MYFYQATDTKQVYIIEQSIFNELVSVRKPLFLEFVIPDSIRNPGFQADFVNWIPACAGMTSKTRTFRTDTN